MIGLIGRSSRLLTERTDSRAERTPAKGGGVHSKRLNILRVVIGLHQGGVQRAVLNLFRHLDRDRFHPIACAIENTGMIGEILEREGFEVIVLGYKRRPLRTVPRLAGLMRDRRIDIVHASSYHPSLYARVAGVVARVPVLISHEHTVYDRRRFHRTVLNRVLAPATDGYIAVGSEVGRQVIEWNGYPASKVEVIYNGVDTNRFRPPTSKEGAKRKVGLDPSTPAVGMVCRLDENKGFPYFFEAVHALRNRRRVQWLVVGTGRREREIRDLAVRQGVGDEIRFLGLRQDVPDWLAAFDVFVSPTLKEGFSNVLLEAMASGCPAVVSDQPGNLEAAEDFRTGLVVPMRDSRLLADRIELLLRDPGLRTRIGRDARRHAEENFSIRRSVEQTMNFYERLWRHGSRRNGEPRK